MGNPNRHTKTGRYTTPSKTGNDTAATGKPIFEYARQTQQKIGVAPAARVPVTTYPKGGKK